MESIIERINNGKFWQFHGGVHPPEQKWLSNDKPIRPLELPKQLIIPLQQHIGTAGKLIVEPGDYVLKGQPLTQSHIPMAVPIHAPTSGTIEKVEHAIIPHPSAMKEPCLFLKPDGKEQWVERTVCDDFYSLSRDVIIEKIANSGISGMGGAGFPTHIKVNQKPVIDFLVINAAECEPYITSDDLIMREHSPSIIDGIKILDHLLLPEHILIGIEDNKPEAISALQKATEGYEKVKVCVLPTKYPTGGEKQLIKALTGKEVPSGVIPGQMGIVMQNVATCYAIADAVINDTPLIKRVVTVTGKSLEKSQNVWALLGTPVEFLLEQCGYKEKENSMLVMGGPMMGFTLPTPKIPIVKTSNCILAPSNSEIPVPAQEQECIRCGQCAEVCPSQLLPQELQWSAKAKDYDQLKKLNLFDCIDCGACAFVCPSQIPLVQYYRVAKAEIRFQQVQEIKADKAKARFEARKARLEREKIEREEKHRKAAEARRAKMNANTEEAGQAKSAVAAALARVKAKKANDATEQPIDNAKSEKKSAVAAAVARAKAKKEAKAAEESATNTNVSPDKDRVAAAIARAKAKKLAQAVTPPPQVTSTGEQQPAESDKKARVAAAVAKAKAKKRNAEKQPSSDEPLESALPENTESPENTVSNKTTDDKKARIAAAVAKAKAKKQAKVDSKSSEKAEPDTDTDTESIKIESDSQKRIEPSNTESEPDDKKARVAAAIAKAKAKKLAKESSVELVEETQSPDALQASDDKKARIALAIAKAKAKKQQAENK